MHSTAEFIKRYSLKVRMFLRWRTWLPPDSYKILWNLTEQQNRLSLKEEQRRADEIFPELNIALGAKLISI